MQTTSRREKKGSSTTTPASMQIARYERYGAPEVMQPGRADIPTPGPGELLIRIRATTVTATEATFRRGEPWFTRLFTGIFRPRNPTLGEELAGEVVALGEGVTRYRVGERVFGSAGPGFGANAEFICLPEDGVLTPMPDSLSFAQAAASVDGGLTALPFLREVAAIQAGQHILIYGASGSVGSAAVQLARHLGARVTAVCSARNHELVRDLGAEEAIDYHTLDPFSGDVQYDIVFDTVGKTRFGQARRALGPDGLYLQAGIDLGALPRALWSSYFGRQKMKIAATGMRPLAQRRTDLEYLRGLLQSAELVPVIDRQFDFDEIVEAHRYVDTGRKRGNVVVRI